MTLNEFCKDSWIEVIEVEDGGKKYRKSMHCHEKEIDLYRSIAHWQFDQAEKRLDKIKSAAGNDKEKRNLLKKKVYLLKQFQESGESDGFSSLENNILMKCLICGVARNRRVCWEIRNFFYFHRSRNNREEGLSECFQILFDKNLSYLFSFDLEKVTERDNENVMKHLSGYIAKCLYPRDILKIYIGERFGEIGDEDESTVYVDPSILNKISDHIFRLFERAYLESPMYAFIHESVSDRKYRSDVSRRQKSNLKKYIEKCLTEKEHFILEPFHAGMITDYIEESLSEGEERHDN